MASGDTYVQYLIETLPNGESGANAVSTTAFYIPFQNFTLKPTRVTDDRTDEFRGTAEPITPDVTGWNQSEGSAGSRLYPNYFGLHMFQFAGAPVSTAGNGVITDPDAATIPTGATRHVWDSSVIDPSVIRSAQTQRFYGNNTTFYLKDRGVTVTGIDIALGDQAQPTTITVNQAGLYQSRISNPSLTPAYDATTILPFYRGNFAISTWLTGTASPIGSSLSFTNPVEPDPVLNASPWPSNWSRPNQSGAVPRLVGTINAKTVDPEDYDAFLAGTAFTYKMKWISTQNIGATAYKYSMWIEGAASYDDYTPEAMEHKLRHGADISWVAGKSGATQAWKVTLVNGIASGGYSSVG